ncbi:hypothetical protein AB9M62_42045 [Bacillales bacterium AN1005]
MLTIENSNIWLQGVVQRIIEKMDWVSEKSKDKIPYTTINGVHDDRSVQNPSGTHADGINW